MSSHYTYRAEWSPEDDEYVGLVAEFPSLSWLAPSAAEAISGAEQLVGEVLADMAETGETPPEPLSERRYSGKLSVRTSPAQHRQLTIEAAEQGVSVNNWVIQKLGVQRVIDARLATAEKGALVNPAMWQIAVAHNARVYEQTGETVSERSAAYTELLAALHALRGQGVSLTPALLGAVAAQVELDDDIAASNKR
ncbi:type II toxin-antitoxin system HicB family antitoxin [Mycolicibacterium sp.]|uniref:type II toxin-antitoxin system HicB family antitoxin n=1 Tax=Mycolicibacterium sp. TaxID=2320850 RepID=UPI0037C7202D